MSTPRTQKGKPQQQVITKADVGEVPGAMIPADLGSRAVTPAAAAFLKELEGPRAVPNKVPLVKINHKEEAFVLPSGEVVASVSGFPIYYYQTRRFYKNSPKPGEKGTPPDCWSPDLLKPDSSVAKPQADLCSRCPMSEFGTARDGRGQACATFTWVFLMNPQFGSPPLAALLAPPSSIRALLGTRFESGYFAQAAARHDVYEIVWSTFRLERASELHCVLVPQMGPACTNMEQVKQIVACRNQFLEIFERMRGTTPEVAAEGEEK